MHANLEFIRQSDKVSEVETTYFEEEDLMIDNDEPIDLYKEDED